MLFADQLERGLIQQTLDKPGALIPVPLHRSRLRQRGFNQATELAAPLARRFKLPLLPHSLKRIRATVAQSELNARLRTSNVRNAFAVTGTELPSHVALVDDVITTGSTIYECARILQRAGVKRVDVWALARTPPD